MKSPLKTFFSRLKRTKNPRHTCRKKSRQMKVAFHEAILCSLYNHDTWLYVYCRKFSNKTEKKYVDIIHGKKKKREGNTLLPPPT